MDLNTTFIFALFLHVFESIHSRTVITGDVVTFECTLTESLPPGDIYWLIEWNNGETLKTSAEETRQLSGEILSQRGQYRTFYDSSGVFLHTHLCQLEISDVRKLDEGYISCVHDGWIVNLGKFFTASLVVVNNVPKRAPKCSYTTFEDGTELSVGTVVQLDCSVLNYDDDVNFSWHIDDASQTRISGTSSQFDDYREVLNFTLRNIDNGVDFICKAYYPNIDEFSDVQECRVRPFAELPSTTITPLTQTSPLGSNVQFTCCGDGIPAISSYEWYLNGVVVTDHTNSRRITSVGGCNQLEIFSLSINDNGTRVMCEVRIPSELSASAVAVLIVTTNPKETVVTAPPDLNPQFTRSTDDNSITKAFTSRTSSITSKSTDGSNHFSDVTTPAPKQSPASSFQRNSIILYVAVALVTVVTLVVIIILVVKYRSRYTDRKSQQLLRKDTAGAVPDIIYQDHLTFNSATGAGNVQMATVDAETSGKHSERNAEGLTYASLALNECIYDNEILNSSADEKVMYADVKHIR